MAKAPYKLPNVFVGCPYSLPFRFQAFKATLDKIPFKWFYADTKVSTRHLLAILRDYMRAADFCVFDISLWNANVALEIGIAEGLGIEYYILVNRRQSSGVPADIQGIQRIEYSRYDLSESSLFAKIDRYLVRDETHPRNIWNALEGEKRALKYYLAMRILAHFRDRRRLVRDDLTRLSRGTYLRREDQRQVIETLADLGLVGGLRAPRGLTLRRHLFKDDIRVG